MKEMKMTRIILSLSALAILSTMCIATASNRPVTSALAQSKWYTIDVSVMKNLPDEKFVTLIGP